MDTIYTFFLLIGALLFFSILATTLSARIGLPFLLIFLFVGMLAREGGIKFDNYYIATFVSQFCLAIILLDGGLQTKVSALKAVYKPAGVLATWGVIATVFSLGLFATYVLPIERNWKMGFLIASIVGSTDAAAVFGLIRSSGLRLIEKVQSILEIESGANDPMAILLVTIFIQFILQNNTGSVSSILMMFIQQMGLGTIFGLVGGMILGFLLLRISLPEGLYALLVMSGGLLVFALANRFEGSGFLAIYISGIIIGNLQRNRINYVTNVTDGLTWLAQASMFLVLGLLVSVKPLLETAPSAILIALFLLFVARPFAVWTSLMFFNFTSREKHYLSWVGLRGAVPVTLAILPVMMGVPDSLILFDISFAIVIFSLLVQGSTVPLMARLFKVTLPPKVAPTDIQHIWLADKVNVDLYGYEVERDSDAEGKNPFKIAHEIGDESIRVFAMVRQDKIVDTKSNTLMLPGDFLWYVAPKDAAEGLAYRFSNTKKQISQNLEFFGEFSVNPDLRMEDLATAYAINLPLEDKNLTAQQYMKKKLESVPSAGDRVALPGEFFLTVKETENSNIKELYLKVPSLL